MSLSLRLYPLAKSYLLRQLRRGNKLLYVKLLAHNKSSKIMLKVSIFSINLYEQSYSGQKQNTVGNGLGQKTHWLSPNLWLNSHDWVPLIGTNICIWGRVGQWLRHCFRTGRISLVILGRSFKASVSPLRFFYNIWNKHYFIYWEPWHRIAVKIKLVSACK